MGEYDISQWGFAGTKIHTPSDPKMAAGVRTGFSSPAYLCSMLLHDDWGRPMLCPFRLSPLLTGS